MKIEHLKNTNRRAWDISTSNRQVTKVHKIVIIHKDRQQKMIIAKGDHYRAVILLGA